MSDEGKPRSITVQDSETHTNLKVNMMLRSNNRPSLLMQDN